MYWFVSPAQASWRASASEAGRDPHERDRGRSTEFSQVLRRRYVFRCSGPFASPTFSGGSCAGRTSLPLPPVARFATSGGAAVDGPPRPFFTTLRRVYGRSAARLWQPLDGVGRPLGTRVARVLPEAHPPPARLGAHRSLMRS